MSNTKPIYNFLSLIGSLFSHPDGFHGTHLMKAIYECTIQFLYVQNLNFCQGQLECGHRVCLSMIISITFLKFGAHEESC